MTKSIAWKAKTLGELLFHAEYYTTHEGGMWNSALGLNLSEMQIHSLKFHDGTSWDICNGIRESRNVPFPLMTKESSTDSTAESSEKARREGVATTGDVLTAHETP